MPALSRTPPKGLFQSPLPLKAGDYLTDESHLFRCISLGPAHERAATILLEDCLTLEPVVLPVDELEGTKLRIVQPHS